MASEDAGLDTAKPAVWLNTLLIKAVVEGLKAAPALNSALTFDPAASSGSLETFEEISVDIP